MWLSLPLIQRRCMLTSEFSLWAMGLPFYRHCIPSLYPVRIHVFSLMCTHVLIIKRRRKSWSLHPKLATFIIQQRIRFLKKTDCPKKNGFDKQILRDSKSANKTRTFRGNEFLCFRMLLKEWGFLIFGPKKDRETGVNLDMKIVLDFASKAFHQLAKFSDIFCQRSQDVFATKLQ